MSLPVQIAVDALWQDFLNGDDKSYTLMYEQCVDGLYAYGLKFTADKALVKDCIQEVFVDLYVKKNRLGGKIKKVRPYLFVALRNAIIKRLTREKKVRPLEDEVLNNSLNFNVSYSPEKKWIEQEISEETNNRLSNAVNGLPPRQKEIIYLKFQEELDYAEIAEIMKISVESARKSMHRALLSLRKLLDKETFQTILLLMLKKVGF